MKKVLSLGLSLLLVAGMFTLPVAAAPQVLTTDAYDNPVRYSVTDDVMSGWGLAFCFTLNAKNVSKNEKTHAINLQNATLTYEGKACAITRIGAVITSSKALGKDDTLFVRDSAGVPACEEYTYQDVAVAKMYKAEAESCTFAVRVVGIPYEQENRLIYARPYAEIVLDGKTVTVYGDTVSTSYGQQLDTGTLLVPYYGTDVDGKGRLAVGTTAVICDTLYLEIQDELDEWMIMTDVENVSTLTLGFYDAKGDLIEQVDLLLPDLSSQNASVLFQIDDVSSDAALVKIDDASIMYWTEWEDLD